MFKRCRCLLLPTNNKANLYLSSHGILANLSFNKGGAGSNQHLYILSDDEIKEGDYFIMDNNMNNPQIVERKEKTFVLERDMKIIATTDSSIDITTEMHNTYRKGILFPQPSQSFIDKYVAEYNKGNVITDVMVEYEEISNGGKGAFDYYHKLKVNPKDNTITIKKIKDSWSRDEVIVLMDHALWTKPPYNQIEGAKWINKNLY